MHHLDPSGPTIMPRLRHTSPASHVTGRKDTSGPSSRYFYNIGHPPPCGTTHRNWPILAPFIASLHLICLSSTYSYIFLCTVLAINFPAAFLGIRCTIRIYKKRCKLPLSPSIQAIVRNRQVFMIASPFNGVGRSRHDQVPLMITIFS